jgi:hypothetical protein
MAAFSPDVTPLFEQPVAEPDIVIGQGEDIEPLFGSGGVLW